jgi:hypothetical protein
VDTDQIIWLNAKTSEGRKITHRYGNLWLEFKKEREVSYLVDKKSLTKEIQVNVIEDYNFEVLDLPTLFDILVDSLERWEMLDNGN